MCTIWCFNSCSKWFLSITDSLWISFPNNTKNHLHCLKATGLIISKSQQHTYNMTQTGRKWAPITWSVLCAHTVYTHSHKHHSTPLWLVRNSVWHTGAHRVNKSTLSQALAASVKAKSGRSGRNSHFLCSPDSEWTFLLAAKPNRSTRNSPAEMGLFMTVLWQWMEV